VGTNDSACIVVAETQGDLHDREMKCLSGWDLSDFDFVGMGHSGFVPVNVKPTVINRLISIKAHDDE
jgi:hypothetical protein